MVSLAKGLLLRRHVLHLDVIGVALEFARIEGRASLTGFFSMVYHFFRFFVVLLGFKEVQLQYGGLFRILLE